MANRQLPIAFPFEDPLALRLANLITQDIEKIEKAALGTQTPWNTKFGRPYKAHYAKELAERIKHHGGAKDIVLDMLPAFEHASQCYIDNPRQRGRPLSQFVSTLGGITDAAKCARAAAIQDFLKRTPQASADAAQQQARQEEEVARAIRTMFDRGEVSAAMAEAFERAQKGQGPKIQVGQTPAPPGTNPPRVTTSTQALDATPPSTSEVKQALESMERIAQGEAEKRAKQQPEEPQTQAPSAVDEALIRKIAREEDVQVLAAVEKAVNPVFGRINDEIEKLRKAQVVTIEIKHPDKLDVTPIGVQHEQFPLLLKTVTLFPVWLPGPAGSGKTTAARNCAIALDIPFHHHGAVDNVYQLLGFIDAGGAYHRTSFRDAYEHGGVFLWDEVDASNPAALVAFNAAIENGECVFPDATIVKHARCHFIAAANTYGSGATHEYVGRTKLDAATVDRFAMIDWPYDEKLERAIAGNTPWTTYVQACRKAVREAGIKHLVTPRASIRGNALLAAGIEPERVIAMTIRKGLSEDQWSNVTRRVGSYRHQERAA